MVVWETKAGLERDPPVGLPGRPSILNGLAKRTRGRCRSYWREGRIVRRLMADRKLGR